MTEISKTDLITNRDGSIFHLHLQPGEVADTVLLVGDPGRVRMVSSFFDRIETKRENREFVTHTGFFSGERISVLSTGIGTDNIDIVLNELDALVNIDLKKLRVHDSHRRLKLIRVGTSGLLNPDVEPGSTVVSAISGGLDGVLHFYDALDSLQIKELPEQFMRHFDWKSGLPTPYFLPASDTLLKRFSRLEAYHGMTLSTPGFYAPQFRKLRLAPFMDSFFDRVPEFSYQGLRIANFEMESSALYGLSAALGHDAITLCIGIANRIMGRIVEDYHPYISRLIEEVLHAITAKE